MSKIEMTKGWYVGERLDEVSEEEAGKSRTDFEFAGSSKRCDGRTVAVVCGVDVGRGLALSALAGAGGFVTVLINEVEEMENSRDWSVWEDSEVTGMKQRYRVDGLGIEKAVMIEISEREKASDAKPRKAWQTCYGPAQRYRMGIVRR